MNWRIEGKTVYYIQKRRKYKLLTLRVVGNQNKDLCIYDKDGELRIGRAEKIDPTQILAVPQGDIGIFEFEKEIPEAGRVLILEIDEELEPLVKQIIAQKILSVYPENYEFVLIEKGGKK